MNTSVRLTSTRAAIAALAVLVVAAAITWFLVDRHDALPDDAVFRLDGEVVTEDDLGDRLAVLEALYSVQRPEGEQEDEFQRSAAKSMAVSMILDRAADEMDVIVSDQAVQKALNHAIEAQAAGRAGFVEFLVQSGLSEADVLDEIRLQLTTTRLVKVVTADVPTISAEQVRRYYDENRERMVSLEKRHLRNIVVTSRADADRVLRQAKSGTPFASLAATWSRDASTRNKAGSLGNVSSEELEPGYAREAFVAPRGGFFGPVRTEHGWNVGQVVSITKSKPLGFADIEERLTKDLQAKELLDTWRTWLGEQLSEADVEYADHYRPEDPDAPPADLPQ